MVQGCPSRRTPLSERLEQTKENLNYFFFNRHRDFWFLLLILQR